MNFDNEFCTRLDCIVSPENIQKNAMMKQYTSFKVGGPVDILVIPQNYIQISNIINLCKEFNIKYYIMGNGSNLLVKDGGIRGVVIKLSKLDKITVEGEKIISQGGTSLLLTSKVALDENLTGMEFACGIPGSIGGAVAMNAGAYNGEISQIVESALIIDNEGEIRRIDKEELELGYRMSSILKYGYVVLEVTLSLKKGEHSKINDRMKELTKRRIERQPLEFPSAGSTFKRPENNYAAKLIEDSGLKGLCIGDAQVSPKHSGFIINKGNASAKDILNLIYVVQNEVEKKFKVELNTEVLIIGEDEMLENTIK